MGAQLYVSQTSAKCFLALLAVSLQTQCCIVKVKWTITSNEMFNFCCSCSQRVWQASLKTPLNIPSKGAKVRWDKLISWCLIFIHSLIMKIIVHCSLKAGVGSVGKNSKSKLDLEVLNWKIPSHSFKPLSKATPPKHMKVRCLTTAEINSVKCYNHTNISKIAFHSESATQSDS